MRLLLVEDDEFLGESIKTGLMQAKYTVDWLKNAEAAQHALKSEIFEIIVLDLGLPKMSGIDLLRKFRAEEGTTPVIILTSRESVEDRINGLDAGADDYLSKPFDLDELLARVRALMRRSGGRADSVIIYAHITLDPASYKVTSEGKEINLPRREFALLYKLMENVGKVMSREKLMQTLYGWEENVDSNALEVHIHNLRKKLNAQFIRTVRGIGYIIDSLEDNDANKKEGG